MVPILARRRPRPRPGALPGDTVSPGPHEEEPGTPGRRMRSVLEALHQHLQVAGHPGQFLRGRAGLGDALGGRRRRGGDTGDGGGDLAAAGGRLGHAAVHLRGGRTLLLDGRGDRRLVVVDLADDLGDLRDRGGRTGGVVLIAETRRAMSSVAFAVSCASSLTSLATTAKPLPASPARAASMVAFKFGLNP